MHVCVMRTMAVLLAASALAGCAGTAPKSRASKSIPYKPAVVAQAATPAASAAAAPARAANPAKSPRNTKLVAPPRPAGASCRSCLPPDTVLINKQTPLAAWDVPEDLVETQIPFLGDKASPRHYLRTAAARAAERMFAAARAAGYQLYGISGFRSFERQRSVFGRHARAWGSVQQANFVSALPGQSEHQSGLALDLTSAAAGYRLTPRFGESAEGKWLKQHAAQFGFILRYPEGKEAVTGYNYEPWHWRYVGRRTAEAIARRGMALEEYLAPKATPGKAASPQAVASATGH